MVRYHTDAEFFVPRPAIFDGYRAPSIV